MAIGVSKLGRLGVGREPSYGTAPTITEGLVITSEDFTPDIGVEAFEEIAGTMEYTRTGRSIEVWNGTLEFPLEIGGEGVGGIGNFLGPLWGKDVVTGTTDPYTHTLEVESKAELDSLTLWFDRNVGYYELTGFKPNTLTINIDRANKVINVTTGGTAQKESTSTDKVLQFSSELPMTPDIVTLKIDGVIADGFERIDLEFSRELEPITGLTGTNYISHLVSKLFSAKFTGAGVFGTTKLDETVRSKYRNRQTLNMEIEIKLSDSRKITFTFPRVQLDTFTGPKLSGSDVVRVDFSGLILKPTSGKNTCVIVNSRSTSYTS
jgi:hypothetical protein